MDKSNQDPKKQESKQQQGPEQPQEPKQPFVSKEDRPEVGINPDTPLQDLHVRDLGAILGFFATGRYDLSGDPWKDFSDKPFPEVAKGKEGGKESLDKDRADTFKYAKDYKDIKDSTEKMKTIEKVEKLERDPVFEQGFQGPGPELQQVIHALAGLTRQVSQLANQMEELRKKVEGKG
jgi:hypothetical protein